MADVQIKISVDSKTAQDNLKKTGDIGKKAADQINIGFTSVTSAFKVFQGALAANVVQSAFGYMTQAVTEFKNVMGDAISEAQAQEDANNSLSNTMKIMGDYTNRAWKEMVDLSNQLAETTTYTDDQVISSLNLAKSLGLSNEQAIKVVKSAADLAAIKNIPLDEAVAGLGKSLTGTAGRLAMLIPQVKDFTAEQLRAGAALEYVNNNMGGSATAKLDTFSGQVSQTKKAWGELLETLGMIVIKNPEVLTAISDLGSTFVSLTKYVSDNSKEISSYISEAIVSLRDNVKSAAKVIDALSEAAGGNSKKIEEVATASYIASSEFENWEKAIGSAIGILAGLYLATTTTSGSVSVLGFILTTVATGGFAALGAAIAATVATVGVFLAQIALVVAAVGGLAYAIKKGMDYFYESTDAYKEHTKALEESRKSYEQVKTPLVDYRSEMDKNTDSMLNQLGLLKEFSFYPEELKKKVIIENSPQQAPGGGVLDQELIAQEERNAQIKAEARELERQATLESVRRTQQEIALIKQENDAIMALEARAREDENFANDLEAQRQFQADKESIQMEYLNKKLALDKTEEKNSKKNTDERNKLLKEQNKKSLEDQKALNNQRIQSDAAVNTAAVNGAFSVANAMIAASNMGTGTAFALTKALLIAQTIMSGYAAQMLASATIPPPAGPIIGAGLLTQAYINAGAIAAVALIQLNAGQGKKGGYEDGGIVPGSSFTGDRVTANVNSGEMILNKQQQARLFEQANGVGGNSSSGIISAINSLGNRIANMEIVLHADGEQIARAANRGYASGIVIGAT